MSLISDYRPLPEDEAGLTLYQIRERRAARLRASFLRYNTEMNRENAEAVMETPIAGLMYRLEIDEEQAKDLKAVAERHLEWCGLAGVKEGAPE